MTGAYFVFLSLFLCSLIEAKIYIKIGQPDFKKPVLGINTNCVKGDCSIISEVVESDIELSNVFELLSQSLHPASKDLASLGAWKVTGSDYFLNITYKKETIKLEIYDIQNIVLISDENISYSKDNIDTAHQISEVLVQKLAGIKSVFKTKIIASCEDSNKHKNLFIMDYDGRRPKQITFFKSISLSPSWSADGKKIAYSRYVRSFNKGAGYITGMHLLIKDLATGFETPISTAQGQNSGAVWSPDGKNIAFTISKEKDPDIYFYNIETKTIYPVVASNGIDVEPSFSPDSKFLVYSSAVTGNPEIYKMNLTTKETQRMTFVRYYNSSPAWSPTGEYIVFAGLDDPFNNNKAFFDLFLLTPDSKIIERLTINSRNNENPSFSPDGRHLVFTSTRNKGSDIYFINKDGTGERRLTSAIKCYSPSWSPYFNN